MKKHRIALYLKQIALFVLAAFYAAPVAAENYAAEVAQGETQKLFIIVMVLFFIVIALLIWIISFVSRVSNRMARDNLRFNLIFDITSEFISEYDCATDVLTISRKNEDYTEAKVTYENYYENLCKRYEEKSNDDNVKAEYDLFGQFLLGKDGAAEIECEIFDRPMCWYRATLKVITDSSGRPASYIGKLTDIQSEIDERNALIEKAQRDSLTDLYNSASFRRKTIAVMDTLDLDPCGTFLIIDIDHFKSVNDIYGHYYGDQVLINMARILKSAFRLGDIIGRLGGDEFIVFMQNAIDRDIVESKCRLIQEKSREMTFGDKKILVSLSIGGTLASKSQSYDELYQKADEALYEIKNRGRNGFEILF